MAGPVSLMLGGVMLTGYLLFLQFG